MILNLNKKEYEIATNLGTSYDIEQQYRKKITKVIEDIEDLTIEEMCKLMHVGLKRKNKDISFEDFFNEVIEGDMSIVDLQKEFTIFITLLTTSGKTESEIRDSIENAYKKNMEKYSEEISGEEISEEESKKDEKN